MEEIKEFKSEFHTISGLSGTNHISRDGVTPACGTMIKYPHRDDRGIMIDAEGELKAFWVCHGNDGKWVRVHPFWYCKKCLGYLKKESLS